MSQVTPFHCPRCGAHLGESRPRALVIHGCRTTRPFIALHTCGGLVRWLPDRGADAEPQSATTRVPPRGGRGTRVVGDPPSPLPVGSSGRGG